MPIPPSADPPTLARLPLLTSGPKEERPCTHLLIAPLATSSTFFLFFLRFFSPFLSGAVRTCRLTSRRRGKIRRKNRGAVLVPLGNSFFSPSNAEVAFSLLFLPFFFPSFSLFL